MNHEEDRGGRGMGKWRQLRLSLVDAFFRGFLRGDRDPSEEGSNENDAFLINFLLPAVMLLLLLLLILLLLLNGGAEVEVKESEDLCSEDWLLLAR